MQVFNNYLGFSKKNVSKFVTHIFHHITINSKLNYVWIHKNRPFRRDR